VSAARSRSSALAGCHYPAHITLAAQRVYANSSAHLPFNCSWKSLGACCSAVVQMQPRQHVPWLVLCDVYSPTTFHQHLWALFTPCELRRVSRSFTIQSDVCIRTSNGLDRQWNNTGRRSLRPKLQPWVWPIPALLALQPLQKSCLE